MSFVIIQLEIAINLFMQSAIAEPQVQAHEEELLYGTKVSHVFLLSAFDHQLPDW